jgi:arginase
VTGPGRPAHRRTALRLIGAPTSAGAYAPGQEKAPAAFRYHGLVQVLESAGLVVDDAGDVPGFRWRPDPITPYAANLEAVQRVCLAVADQVASAMDDGAFALVVGGDCTIEVGVVAAALRGSRSIGLIYIDRDLDLNPPAESDGALDWTGVAHLLAIEGTAEELSRLGPRYPLLTPADVLYFGADNMARNEPQRAADLALQIIRRSAVEADPGGTAAVAVRWADRFDRLLIHLDVDVLDFAGFPFAENVRRDPGLTFEALGQALTVLLAAPNAATLTITEVNPDHAPDEAEAFGRFNAMLAAALGQRAT